MTIGSEVLGIGGWRNPSPVEYTMFLGLRHRRLPLNLEFIYPAGSKETKWWYLDDQLHLAELRGITILPVVVGVPRHSGLYNPVTDAHRKAVAGAMATAAARYPQIKFWQLFNEVNGGSEIGKFAPPAVLAPTAVMVAKAMREVNPSVEFVAPGLMGIRSDRSGWNAADYVRTLLRLDLPEESHPKMYFSRWAVHCYQATVAEDLALVDAVSRELDPYGSQAGKPVDVTEFAWPTGGGDEWPTIVTLDEQARRLREFVLEYLKRPRAGRASWFGIDDEPELSSPPFHDHNYFSGLFDNKKNPKPAATVFRNMLDENIG